MYVPSSTVYRGVESLWTEIKVTESLHVAQSLQSVHEAAKNNMVETEYCSLSIQNTAVQYPDNTIL